MVEFIILGTSSMVPTKERNVQAFYLEHNGEGMLFDCGEGTQRQLNIAGVARGKVRKVFISHWHGDHVGGLISLIQTIGNSEYTGTLRIYGPQGSKERMFHLMNATLFENKVEIEVHELVPKKGEELFFLETDLYKVSCIRVDHSVPCIGYAWYEKDKTRIDMATCRKFGLKEGPLIGKLTHGQEVTINGTIIKPNDVLYKVAGKKIAIIPDTQTTADLIEIARFADVLICEATYSSDHEEKAREFKHMTGAQAAHVATTAEVKRLILTHFSQRYPTIQPTLDEARAIFPNTDAAFDLMKITL